MQVYLPDDLYQQVKSQRLSASSLLQDAIRRELYRQSLHTEAERYLAELEAEIGPPSDEDMDWARSVIDRVKSRQRDMRAS